jgi:hypothetical protein
MFLRPPHPPDFVNFFFDDHRPSMRSLNPFLYVFNIHRPLPIFWSPQFLKRLCFNWLSVIHISACFLNGLCLARVNVFQL